MKSIEVQNIRACLEVAAMAVAELENHFRASAPPGSTIHWFEEFNGKTIIREGMVAAYDPSYSVWIRVEPTRMLKLFPISKFASELASEDDYARSKLS